ncbi:receptor for retinol uptake stra6-like [Lineus longissimus]|uniref:receptor for retinol uptake stra6-like n=1 Tax=Lineus longissimus TaxID=88925 RepID=UPI002B4EF353
MATSLGRFSELYQMYQAARGENITARSACDRLVKQDVFYYWVMLPSVGIILSLMFFVRRVNLFPRCIDGRFAILIPMNFLDDKGYRLSYAAVFGLTASLCLKMILQEYPVHIPGPSYVHVLVKIATMLLYGFALYPLLAGLTMGTVLSLGLSTLYIWMFFIVNMIHLTDCSDDWPWQFFMETVFMQACPEILCSFFLSIMIPCRFVQKLIKRIKKENREETQEFFEDSYQAKYVRALFKKKPKWVDDGAPKPKLKHKLINKVKAMTYTKVAGFRYSPRIIATYTAGVILLYLIAVYTGTNLLRYIESVLGPLNKLIEPNKKSLMEVYANHSFGVSAIDDLVIVHHWIWTGKFCVCLALSLACFIGVVQIALGFRAYRDDILSAWSGDSSRVGKRRGYPSLTVGFVRYSGYQVAYIFWAFVLQFAFLAVLFAGLSYIIFIPMIYSKAMWFLHILRSYWPIIAISLGVNIASKIAAIFVFLQKRGKVFALNNRRLLFCVMYFLFFYNVFVGLFSCLMRMIKSILFGLFFLSRLDCSTLPRLFEKMDPGFKAYVGLIHVENAHTNPVLMTFVNMVKEEIQGKRDTVKKEEEEFRDSYKKIGQTDNVNKGLANEKLKDSMEKLKDAEQKEVEKAMMRRRRAMRAQWFLAYTLLNNLPLRATRKHYIDAEKERIERRFRKDRQEGDEDEDEDMKKGDEDAIELEEVEVNVNGDTQKDKSDLAIGDIAV